MANTAEVINFPVPDVAPKEPRVADLDDGFTRIANELLEAVMLAGLSQHQLLVFMAVMRKTYGFNKKTDWVSNDQLSALTGLKRHSLLNSEKRANPQVSFDAVRSSCRYKQDDFRMADK